MLTDNTAHWLQRQETVTEDTPYDDLVKLLQEKYSISKAQRFQMHSEPAAISQKAKETEDEFPNHIEQFCNQLNLDDASKIHYFVNGLQPSLRNHVMLTQPTTMETAINAARAEEGVLALQRSKSSDKDDEASLTTLVKRLVSQLVGV